MSKLSELSETVRKIMLVLLLVDTSGSMKGSKIGTVNGAVEEMIPALKSFSDSEEELELMLQVVTFDSKVQEVFPAPVSIEDVIWKNIEASGLTCFGDACDFIDKKLSRKVYLKSLKGCYAPVIILLSDGAPTDGWKRKLDKLKKNGWYKEGIKIAIDIDSKENMSCLEEFTGTREAVLKASDKESLKRMIRKIAVKSSEIQSHSVDVGKTEETSEDRAKKVAEETVTEVKKEESVDDKAWEGF